MEANIIIQAVAASMFSKVLVDATKKMFTNTPSRFLPILALIYGEICAFALLLSQAISVNLQTGATAFLVGVLAMGSAIGVTELQKAVTKE